MGVPDFEDGADACYAFIQDFVALFRRHRAVIVDGKHMRCEHPELGWELDLDSVDDLVNSWVDEKGSLNGDEFSERVRVG